MPGTQQARRKNPLVILLIVISALNLLLAALLVTVFLQYRALMPEEGTAEQSQAAPEASQEESSEAPAAMPVSEADIALYQAQCREIPFSELLRDADAMKRQYFTFTGKIVQVMEGQYRLRIIGSDVEEDVVYLDYALPAGSERLLEGDYVTVWGQSEGLYTYTSVKDEQITVPRLHVSVLKRLTAEEADAIGKPSYERLAVNETRTDPETGVTYTLTGVCMRPAVEDDYTAAAPETQCCILFLLDVRNDGTEDFAFYPRYFSAYADGYDTAVTLSYSDSPDGLDRLKSATLEPGYGTRGHITVTAANDWKTAELRVTDSLRFQIRHSDFNG